MANGKVCTGFSKPYVADYAVAGGVVSYSNPIPLARGVNVSMSLNTGDSTFFHADNVQAESAGGVFTGGTVSLTVDGLKDAARKKIMGVIKTKNVTAGGKQVTVDVYDDTQVVPNVGVGFIVRFQENGVVTYVPYVLAKVAFKQQSISANTQGENIEFQTQALEAVVMRDDSNDHVWQMIGEDQTSEADAETVLKAMLGGSGE